MSDRERFENGEIVIDGRGNRGQVIRFWSHNKGGYYYYRVRLIDGPRRNRGEMWSAADHWRGLVDYAQGTEDCRCLKCGRDFLSPIPLAPGEEFCRKCMGEELSVWLKDFADRLRAWKAA